MCCTVVSVQGPPPFAQDAVGTQRAALSVPFPRQKVCVEHGAGLQSEGELDPAGYPVPVVGAAVDEPADVEAAA